MSVVAADVTSRAKEFAALDEAEITRAISDAALQVNTTVWGSKADLATICLAAHFLTVWNPGLAVASGAVQSERVGDVARTYAVAAPAADRYDSTRWGREYSRLLRQLPSALVL